MVLNIFSIFQTTYVKKSTILSKYSYFGDYKEVNEYDLIYLYAHQIKPQPM